MPLFVNSNISSLNSQRHLNATGRSQAQAFERLSSGLRINSASDDAAGLAITRRMDAQVRSLNTAVRNANDGVSLVQTSESALSESSNILTRMRELAVQATNDTNTNSDRASLQAEVTQLVSELNRIGDATEFNTQALLDGSFSGREFHVGFKAGQTISLTIGDARATSLGARAQVDGSALGANAIGDDDVFINGEEIRVTVAADDTLSSTQHANSSIAKANAINEAAGLTGVYATVAETSKTGANAVTAGAGLAAGDLKINGIDIGAVTGMADKDVGGVVSAAINTKTGSTGVVATTEADGTITLAAADGRNIDIDTTNADAIDWFGADSVTRGNISLSSNAEFVVSGDNSVQAINVASTLHTLDTDDVVSAINIGTKAGANDALAVIDAAIDKVAQSRGDLGAMQNRLVSTVGNLQSVSENLSAASSRIRDTDFAAETASLTRAQIIQQAGVAMLAQANASPQTVLALLS
jgi:flagellin